MVTTIIMMLTVLVHTTNPQLGDMTTLRPAIHTRVVSGPMVGSDCTELATCCLHSNKYMLRECIGCLLSKVHASDAHCTQLILQQSACDYYYSTNRQDMCGVVAGHGVPRARAVPLK